LEQSLTFFMKIWRKIHFAKWKHKKCKVDAATPRFVIKMLTPWSQNKDTQKVDLSNCCYAMINFHHQNADAMVLASALMGGTPPGHLPFWILSGGWMPLILKCTGYNQGVSILMTNYGYTKIIGKTKKSGLCIVSILCPGTPFYCRQTDFVFFKLEYELYSSPTHPFSTNVPFGIAPVEENWDIPASYSLHYNNLHPVVWSIFSLHGLQKSTKELVFYYKHMKRTRSAKLIVLQLTMAPDIRILQDGHRASTLLNC
jgi:hypothetical protein